MPIMTHDYDLSSSGGPDRPYAYTLRNIDPELWYQVKVYAARQGITIRDLILETLRVRVQSGQ